LAHQKLPMRAEKMENEIEDYDESESASIDGHSS
jgi:hypothetical protein